MTLRLGLLASAHTSGAVGRHELDVPADRLVDGPLPLLLGHLRRAWRT